MSERVIRRVIVHGRVQGVGYRDWTRHVARARGIEGWVRNRNDGSVEAVFAGTGAGVSDMIGACRKGPPSAVVTDIEEHDAVVSDLDLRRGTERFSVIATV
ncbi:MAG: acylphosphatase [Pseudorhodoplanes sp.]|uniref:acylphosphatase n=1 Tax=Pseudorhodoplanes sp. TaxID=1934341 RepID=UPI003D0B2D72